MACVNWVRSSTTAALHLFSQETDLLIKVIMKCVNIKLWDILGCFHYILNPPRTFISKAVFVHVMKFNIFVLPLFSLLTLLHPLNIFNFQFCKILIIREQNTKSG